ncbi:MAG: Gfo/Idh/MocA family protein [Planctomycetota bacterium]
MIGTGIRGKYLIANMPEEGRVVAACDSYLPRVADTIEPKGRYAAPLARFKEHDAARCTPYQDFRKMIDRERLDAVMIATPDHNHVLPAMLACQAGMDVYVEKALSLYVAEGRALVEAVRRAERVCQVGSQNRSMAVNQLGSRLVREGRLGKVSLVELPNYRGPMRYEGIPEEPVPEGLAWDLFCGQSPMRPHNRKLWVKDEFKVDGQLWRGWDLWRSYSGHLMTNWGAHSVDIVQLALGTSHTGPVEIWPLVDGYDGPMQSCPVAARYENGVELRFSLRVTDKWTFHGEHGKLLMRRNTFTTDPPDLAPERPAPELVDVWEGPNIVARPHIQNWLDCIKTRGRPNAPVDVGHGSVTICHLAAIAREVRRRLRWDPDKEIFPGDAEANALLARPRRKGFELPEIS